jgi:hypothetical protein
MAVLPGCVGRPEKRRSFLESTIVLRIRAANPFSIKSSSINLTTVRRAALFRGGNRPEGGMARVLTMLRPAVMTAGLIVSLPALASPLEAPTVDYTQDVLVTRPTDHAFKKPERIVFGGRHIRIESVGIVTIVDLDRRDTVTLIPRVRTYWRPAKIKEPVVDPRRWAGVEAQSAERLGEETLLGRQVTKYKVKGTIFDARVPFEGEAWTTPENIVMRVVGTGKVNGASLPVEISTQQLVIAPADQRAFGIPERYGRAASSERNPRQEDY